MSTRADEDLFNHLHSLLARTYIDRVTDPECSAADLNGARQFLKDNDVVLIVDQNNNLSALDEALKEKRAKRKLRIVGEEE